MLNKYFYSIAISRVQIRINVVAPPVTKHYLTYYLPSESLSNKVVRYDSAKGTVKLIRTPDSIEMTNWYSCHMGDKTILQVRNANKACRALDIVKDDRGVNRIELRILQEYRGLVR